MECMDELKQPLLNSNPKENESPIGCIYGNGLFKGVLVRCEEEKMLPPLAWSSYCTPADVHKQQLLNACSLPSNVDAIYPSALAWGIHGNGFHRNDCLETTFVDISPGSPLERKLASVSRDGHSDGFRSDEEELLPHYADSSSEDLSDSESESSFSILIPQDHLGLAVFSMLCCFWPLGIAAFYLSQKTNKASAQGDFRKASSASQQALWLAVLSIVFGVITYICAVAALVSYLSGRPP